MTVRLRELREERGLTRSKLAKEVGVHWTYIWQLEAGKRQPSLRLARKLAETFGVSLDELLGGGEREEGSRRMKNWKNS